MSINDIQNYKRLREIKTQYGISPGEMTKIDRKILEKLDIQSDCLDKRLCGLEIEDEFFLIILAISNVEQITKLHQNQIVNHEKYTVPDYLLAVDLPDYLNEGDVPKAQRMFVEVKKCKENAKEFVFTINAYQKLRNYGLLYSLPLFFAVKLDIESYKEWFFISGKTLEKLGKKEVRKINNREQECFVLAINELGKTDTSCLWLKNNITFIKLGTIIEKSYDTDREGVFMNDKDYGALVSYTIRYDHKICSMDLTNKETVVEAVAFSTMIDFLSQGAKKVSQEGMKTQVTYVADANYLTPYYRLILDTYLELRRVFRPEIKEADNSIEYYVHSFSEFDYNLILYAKKAYNDLVNAGVIHPVQMMPDYNARTAEGDSPDYPK